jgi:transaldolase
MKNIKSLKIKIFADGANIEEMFSLNKQKIISGFTTNPSLMRQQKIYDYETYAKKITKVIKNKSLSFEVTSDCLTEMETQAVKISKWSKNIYVKIPFVNSMGIKTLPLIKKLSNFGMKINVTAIFSYKQAQEVLKVLNKNSDVYLSIFAGRIADTGNDPCIIISKCVASVKKFKKVKILWASCRQIFSIFEANKAGCHIITVPHQIIRKFNIIGKNLDKYALETSREFYSDSKKINFKV